MNLDPKLTPEHEQALCNAILRYQVGIDPDRLSAVLDLAAVGITNSAWRNSPVEDWHAEGRLSNGDMLRTNAFTTWRVREIIRRWRADEGLSPDAPTSALDKLDHQAVVRLAVRIYRWLITRTRRLPTGTMLLDVAGDDLEALRDHVDATLSTFAATAEHQGVRFSFCRMAAHGGLACRHWWGTPTWPALVDTFIRVLDEPDHAHWRPMGKERTLPPQPTQVSDRALLRRLLLQRPWELDADAARWIVAAGIGFLQEPLPQLPEEVRRELQR